ncbi:GNAT family N-acetyltransferase [Sphingobacterium kitahiroshimense]|uniref:GNAT family N-acetyltransferase n=1 Tax=Sphingobacterium kitahiroshimense TaxID=470446 RepID=A0ABV0BW06_9SPHI
MEIREVSTEEDIMICKDIILQFSNNFNAERFLQEVIHMIKKESTHISYLYDIQCEQAVAFITYRHLRTFRRGPLIFIDDLYTTPRCRGRGYAKRLLEHVKQIAHNCEIKTIHLDAGFPVLPPHFLFLNADYDLTRYDTTMMITWNHA